MQWCKLDNDLLVSEFHRIALERTVLGVQFGSKFRLLREAGHASVMQWQ